MESYISELDSKLFGFNVAKVNDWGTNPEETLSSLRKENVKLVIARLPSEHIETINCLEKLGFQIKDMQLTFCHKLKNLPTIELPNNMIIRDALEADMPSIRSIAKQAFANYGHYSANPYLDKSKVNAIYEDWASRSYYNTNVADKFIVLEASNNEVAGFLTFRTLTEFNKVYAAGGVGAVAHTHRNQGIFQLLVNYGPMALS